jgi:hypothetical protein
MRDILLNKIKETILNSNKEDVYAVSLYLEYYNDNLYEPNVILSYNTNENVKNVVSEGVDELEARWNYAYWLQDDLYVFGENETKEHVKEWFINNGYEYLTYDEYYSRDVDEELICEIDDKIKNELIEVVKKLHETNFIKEQFGKEIPVLIHELEYYDEILEINKKANPSYVIEEFSKFFM